MFSKRMAKVRVWTFFATTLIALSLLTARPVAAATSNAGSLANCYIYGGAYWDGPYPLTLEYCAGLLWNASNYNLDGIGYGLWGEHEVVANRAGQIFYRNVQQPEWVLIGTLSAGQPQAATPGYAQQSNEQLLWQQCNNGDTDACQQLTAMYNRRSAAYDRAMQAWDSYYDQDWVDSFGLMGE